MQTPALRRCQAARGGSRAGLGTAGLLGPITLEQLVHQRRDFADLRFGEVAGQHAGHILYHAALLALVWAMLCGLQSRTSTSAVLWVLVLDALATAVTVMLSGYYRGGLLGLGLAAALAGATLASYIAQPQSPTSGSLGMSVIGIFAVVLVGRFFGTLSTGLAACLLLAPLLAWTVELPRLRRLAPGWRGTGRLACVAVPLIVVVMIAQRKFTAASTARSRPSEPSAIRDLIEK